MFVRPSDARLEIQFHAIHLYAVRVVGIPKNDV